MSDALGKGEPDDPRARAAAGPEGQAAAAEVAEVPPDTPGVHLQDLQDVSLIVHASTHRVTEQLVQDTQDSGVLHLDMQPDEDEWMMDIGLLNSRCNSFHTTEIAVSPRVSAMAAAENVKMLFVFNNLRNLRLRLDVDRIEISQRLVCAAAELLQLTCLHILHGSMGADVDIAHWSSLRNLAELKLLPAESTGLGDEQLEQLTLLSTNLTHLSIRACPSRATSAGRWHLGSLASVQELSCCPLGQDPTAQDLQRLVDMPQLKQLTLGLKRAAEVVLFSNVTLPAKKPHISLMVLDAMPTVSATDVLSVTSWCLSHHLVSLTVGPLSSASPGDVLVMLQTLKQLRELKLQLSAPRDEHSSGTVDLLALTPLQHLTGLELLTSPRLYVPLNVKIISLAILAWPKLASLRLSLSGKPELMPEALALCDNFRGLTELQLFSPPDDLTPDTAADHLPVSTSSSDGNCLFPGYLTGSGSWVQWAASGLGGLGHSALSSTSSTGATAATSSSSGSRVQAGVAGFAGRSSSLPVRWADDVVGVSSPLSRDARQRSLVKQQQQQVREQWQQQQRLMMENAPEQKHLLSYDEQQEVPAAVDAFQRYKIKPPTRQYSADSSAGGTMPRQHAAVHSTHSTLDSQASGSWSPGWLLQKFASLGSPVAAASAADGAAAAAAAAASGAGISHLHRSISDNSSPKGAWSGRVMTACSGPSYRHTYSGSTSVSLQQQHSRPALYTPFYSTAAAAAAASADCSGTTTSQQQQQQQQGGALSAPAPPGHELAMYRASSRMMPFVLNYLPESLRTLCLESFHLVVVGLPVTSGNSTQHQQDSTSSIWHVPQRQRQRQQQCAASGSQLQAAAEAAATADVTCSSSFDAAAAAGLAATAALAALATTVATAASEQQQEMHEQITPKDKSPRPAAAVGNCAAADSLASAEHSQEQAADGGTTDAQKVAAAAGGLDAASATDLTAPSDSAAIMSSNTASSSSSKIVSKLTPLDVSDSSTVNPDHSSSTSKNGFTQPSSRRCLPLQNLRHLELEECCVDDASMSAVLQAATGLRTLELAGLEGLTNAGLTALTQLRHLSRLVIEAEHTNGITLQAFDAISQLATLKKLHWCSRDSMHGPTNIDWLTERLCALTGLRQLVLITHQQELLTAMSGWKIVLHHKLPLCRLVLWRELVVEEPWGDVPDEVA